MLARKEETHDMPKYTSSFTYRDGKGRETIKQFSGDFTDDATANLEHTALLNALVALTNAGIVRHSIARVTDVVAVPDANSRVAERISATVYLEDGVKKANVTLPSPHPDVLNGLDLLKDSPLWTAFTDEFVDDYTISDGEHVSSTLRGKLITVRSG